MATHDTLLDKVDKKFKQTDPTQNRRYYICVSLGVTNIILMLILISIIFWVVTPQQTSIQNRLTNIQGKLTTIQNSIPAEEK